LQVELRRVLLVLHKINEMDDQAKQQETKAEVKEMNDSDFEYWAEQYNVAVDELKAAINIVGNDTGELRKYFKK